MKETDKRPGAFSEIDAMYAVSRLIREVSYYGLPWETVVDLFCKTAIQGKSLEEAVTELSDLELRTFMHGCIEYEDTQGTLICEQEISRRGMHIEDNTKRFEL